jgi:thiol-disulfide isomerase/thioredoxin
MGQFTSQVAPDSRPEKSEWEKILEANAERGSVLYYFLLDSGCNYCDLSKPWIQALEKKYLAKGLDIVKIATDEMTGVSQAAGVSGVPVLIFTHNGSPLNRVVGWGEKAYIDIEVRLGLTDFFDEKAGLEDWADENLLRQVREKRQENVGTCLGCDDKSNAGIAELAEGIGAELAEIKAELAEIKKFLFDKP